MYPYPKTLPPGPFVQLVASNRRIPAKVKIFAKLSKTSHIRQESTVKRIAHPASRYLSFPFIPFPRSIVLLALAPILVLPR